jgi:predicted N-acyltransferase
MHSRIIDAIDEISASDWNRLAGPHNPFLHHEFLSALERHQCVGERYGWIPQHIVIEDKDGHLIGASPLYLKDNSYGEFVFDWAWADAYHRSGREYYPKLVSATPYTPVTGHRLLIDEAHDNQQIASALTRAAIEHAERLQVSSLHWLFPPEHEAQQLKQLGMMLRMGYQFHWHNQGYHSFDDFLQQLSSRKRKQIKRERRQVDETGVELRVLSGHDISPEQWAVYHRHYASTFYKLGGYATLSLEFFSELGRTMPDNIVLVMAYYQGKPVASAFCLRGDDCLYGRHWGCDADFNNLHFEACYYQGIDYCIEHGLTRFEPGAQGEHKISRGFLPTATWSAHWLADAQFRMAIEEFLGRETVAVQRYIEELNSHSPFKQSG